jgi:uncharacterized protein involved in exopolysaccharide biosynthesis
VNEHTGFTLRDIFHVLFKRKWTMLLFFLATTGTVSAIAVAFEQTLYSASSQILLRPGREHVYDISTPSPGSVPPRINFDMEEQAARTIQLLTGRYLSEQVVQTLGARTLCMEPPGLQALLARQRFCRSDLPDEELADRVVSQVQDNVWAERVGFAALVKLTFRHQDPVLAASVVNTLSSLYVERHLGVLKDPQAETFLMEQSGLAKERLAESEQAFASFKERNGIISSVREAYDMAMRQLTSAQVEHDEALSRQRAATAKIEQLRAQLSGTLSSPDVVSAKRNRLIHLERQQRDAAARLGESNPSIAAMAQEIHRSRDELLQLEERKTQDNDLYERVQEELLLNEAELRGLRARRIAQEPKLVELKSKIDWLDRLTPEFERLQQAVQNAQQNYRLYMVKSEETRISNVMDAEKIASVKVIEPARVPRAPLPSRVGLKMLLGVMFGILGGIVIAFVLEFIGDRLETSERAESVLGVPVLASIPVLRFK